MKSMPRIFIASSTEGLEIAYALQELLQYSAECTVWDQDVFVPSSNTLTDLISKSQSTDFGVFVFSFEDTAKIRNAEEFVVRDNVLFEFGLFIGTIGLQNCFIVRPNNMNNIHLPTDLVGINLLNYPTNRSDGNYKEALGPVANQIKKSIQPFANSNTLSDALQKQINNSGLSSFYTCRDDYSKYRKDVSSIDKYINTAKKSVALVSISLTTGIQFDDICLTIKQRLSEQSDFVVTVSLLNPLHDELFKSLESMFEIKYTELQEQTKSTLKKLHDLKMTLARDAQKRFILKVHNTLPFGSAILLDYDDDCSIIQIETKPYKVGMRKSFAMEFTNNGGAFFKTLITSYLNLIKDGQCYENLKF